MPRCTAGKVRPAAVIIIATLFVSNYLAARQKTAENNPETRSCTLREEGPIKNSAKRKETNTHAANRSANNACLEIRLSSLAVQERLQAFIRDQKWRVGDEEISDSLWTFRRELYREELLASARPDPGTEKVNWARGRAALQIRTIDLENGFTRVIVSANFQGFGEPEDKFAMQRASWKLISTGRLEALLVSALRPPDVTAR